MYIPIENPEKELQKLKQYMEKYGHLYTKTCREYIEENYLYFLRYPTAPDVLMQIYETISAGYGQRSFYNAHFNKIQELFGLDKNVLEIAGGKMPAFANKVATYQQQTKKGSITVYDPELIITKPNFKNLRLYKEEFSTKTDIHSYDLVMGLLPCDATESIISASCRAKKDFYVAMCGCTHFEGISPFTPVSPYVYQQYVMDMAEDLLKKYDNGELVVDYLPQEYEIDYPILYNRKK